MVSNKAVVYARVSTDRQEHSIESQKEYYSDYAVKNGYELVDTYFDEGLSATSANRKYFLKMLYDAGLDATSDEPREISFKASKREPLFNWIITKDASRFARNVNGVDIARKLREKEVYIEFENMGFTTADYDWEFRLSLFLTFSQQESIDKSNKLKKAYKIRSDKGLFHTPNVPLGYFRDEETGDYYINEEEAIIIRVIFDLYVNHRLGSTKISDILNNKGYRSKTGKRFTSHRITRLIKNEKYKGLVITNRFTHTDVTGSYKRIERPQSEWEYHEDAIASIVDTEIFDKAQQILESRSRPTKQGMKGMKVPKDEFYQKIFCGRCGSDYTRHSSIKNKNGERVREYFYGCRKRRNKNRNHEKCSNRGISHKRLVEELSNMGENIPSQFSEARVQAEGIALDKIISDLDNKIENSESEISKIREKIDELNGQINNITNSIATGTSDTVSEVMHDKIEQIKQEQSDLEESKLDYDTVALERQKQDSIDKYNEIIRLSKKDEYDYNEVFKLINRIEVYPSRKIFVFLETPTLIPSDNIQQTGNFLHKDNSGAAQVAFWFQY